jgi:hypothetical protein
VNVVVNFRIDSVKLSSGCRAGGLSSSFLLHRVNAGFLRTVIHNLI